MPKSTCDGESETIPAVPWPFREMVALPPSLTIVNMPEYILLVVGENCTVISTNSLGANFNDAGITA